MSLYTGFAAGVTIGGQNILTIGDVNSSVSNTEIPVQNRASNKVRYLQGMETTTFDLVVQSGTDPEDANSVDGYAILSAARAAGTVLPVEFNNSAGATVLEENMIVTKFDATEPVDGLETANVSLKVSAKSPPTQSGS